MKRYQSAVSVLLLSLMLILLTALIILFCAAKAANRYDTFFDRASFRTVSDLEAEETPVEGYAGVQKTYRFHALPRESAYQEVLGIFVAHQYAEAWLDGVLVFRSAPLDTWRVCKSPGCYWIYLPLEREEAEVLLILTPVYESVVNKAPTVHQSSFLRLILHAFAQDGPEMALALSCMLLGITFSAASGVIHLEKREKIRLFCLGAFTLCCGTWRLLDLRLADMLLSPRIYPALPVLSNLASLLGLVLMAPFFTGFLLSQEGGWKKRSYRLLHGASVSVCAALILSQLLGFRDIRANLPFISAQAVVMLLLLALRSLWELPGRIRREESPAYELFYLAFSCAGILDVVFYYIRGTSLHMNRLMWISLIHIAMVGVFAVREAVDQENRIFKTIAELTDARVQIMLSQIQPHFLYNTLNVIQDLCHEDPKAAEAATVKFSQYLRQNMESLSSSRTVPFAVELAHTRTYLDLEQMRFGNALHVRYDIQGEDFQIPTLTLQPIVENAVRHGARKREEGGAVAISTRSYPDHWEVVVEDDGPGFDPRKPRDGKHVGIRNVRDRLRRVSGGDLRISSAPGAGTRAVILLPREQEEPVC